MANIQRGDERQYYQQEASRTNIGDMALLANEALNTGMSIVQKANESNLANNQIDLSTKFLAKNNEINTKYQADPTNPEREVEIQEAFEQLAGSYNINPVCQGQWNTIKNDVYNRYKQHNAQWVEKQQTTNIETNLKNGYETLSNQISMLGLNGASVDDMRLVYANGIQGLRTSATAKLGSVVVDNFLKDADHDFMTTYISAVALNNPLEAQRLLADEGVRNDIGRAETIEKLENYVMNSVSNQQKRTAVAELGNVLRSMNSDEADDILNGKADLNRVMKFIEGNKNLPEGSKDLILGIYGIGKKQEYIYEPSTGKIVKKEDASSKSGNGLKLTPEQKGYVAETLENDLHDLMEFSLSGEGVKKVKDIKKNKNQVEAQNSVIGYMQKVAGMQARIDTAYNAGAISKDERKRLMNSYITPVTDYLEANLEQLDEGRFLGSKLGYDKIKKQFSTEGLKKQDDIRAVNRQKLFAQNYYLDELHKVVQGSKGALKSVYDIESLSPAQQREIYQTASDNALKRAKRWTDKPEYFFAKEFPEIYSEPFVMFKQDKALQINKNVAEAVYKREFENPDGTSNLDLKEFANSKMYEEIVREAKANRIKANGTLFPQEQRVTLHAPDPKTYQELESKLKEMGYTINDFHNFAVENGYVQPTNNNQWRQGGYLNPWYMRAYRDLRYADALKNKK